MFQIGFKSRQRDSGATLLRVSIRAKLNEFAHEAKMHAMQLGVNEIRTL
jgi:hypothetical protein